MQKYSRQQRIWLTKAPGPVFFLFVLMSLDFHGGWRLSRVRRFNIKGRRKELKQVKSL
jgi:hypothetical protein